MSNRRDIDLVFVRQNIFCGGRTSIFAEECLSGHPLVRTSLWYILEEVIKIFYQKKYSIKLLYGTVKVLT